MATHLLRPETDPTPRRLWKIKAPVPVGMLITLTFASSTTDAESGVSAVAGGTDAEQSFAFNDITPRTGLPIDLEISESSTLKLVVTFPSDYAGANYTYTDTGGTPHNGTFPATNGTEDF